MYGRVCVAVLLCVAACAHAQTAVQETQDEGYFSYIRNRVGSLSETDWRGMVRSVVDSVMQYFVASTTRDGSSSRSFGGDVAVHFIEGNPSLRHYAQLAHDYVVSFDHFFN